MKSKVKSEFLTDYPYMRAWCDFVGYQPSLIQSQVDRARKLNAPQDVIEECGPGQWLRLADLKSPAAYAHLRTAVEMLDVGRPICDQATQERHTAAGTIRVAVGNEVQKLLSQGKVKRQTVARKLAMSTRTLARRLSDEGTTYDEVVDHLRQSLALQYIGERGMQLSQVAWLLGYEGATSFNHAFRRWTGRSPSEARNEKLLHAQL